MNAASFTVIAAAMKLPMDLNNSMRGYVDQAAKHGSVGFMCAMMANVLRALATMDNKELIANIMPLGVQIIHACSSLAILKSKQILESKYQAARETALKDQELQRQGRLTVDKLKQHVRKYWIMAATGECPQFMTVCSVTSCDSGPQIQDSFPEYGSPHPQLLHSISEDRCENMQVDRHHPNFHKDMELAEARQSCSKFDEGRGRGPAAPPAPPAS
ncbi:hypothetical protein L1887_10575 [Cichorium endivia]|nr:hypothetical protein L1887_10575 [Cichorium endivia]